MSRLKSFILIVLVVGLLCQTACKEASDSRVIKLAHGLDVSHPVHKAMVFMGERLK